MLDEFVAMAGCHRKHAVRLLGQRERSTGRSVPKGRRIYDEAVRQALVVVGGFGQDLRQEAEGDTAQHSGVAGATRTSGSRRARADVLGERQYHGPAAQAVREQAGIRRRLKKRRKMGSRVPVRTFMDWNEPEPGHLVIDLVAHGGGAVSGAYIHSLVATDISSGWTEAVPLLAREQSLVVEGLEAISSAFPVPVHGIDSDNDSVFINETLVGHFCERG